MIEVSLFFQSGQQMIGSLGGFSKVSNVERDIIVGLLLDPSLMLFVGGGRSPGSHIGCHSQIYFSSSLFFSARLWPPDFHSLPSGPFYSKSLNQRFRCHALMSIVWSLSLISYLFNYYSR
ncbi:hypothetical protein MA16_Dca024664 [Dendrobium catenatum]|uniref:Uncharacterized protein n=1 Tax=Dendrobium catenatum TaxID=906689 RepID=A0A2I0WFZ4_9ASPA|nr:hypothetical protein MA16_Dca024664 [Dendrobium catenatum]